MVLYGYNSRSKILKFISNNSAKLVKISESINENKEKIRATILAIKVSNYILGEVYKNLEHSNEYKESVGELYYSIKKASTIADKALNLLSLDPIRGDEVYAKVDAQVKLFFQYESLSELLVQIKTPARMTTIYHTMKTTITVEVQKNFSLVVMNGDIPFNYDNALQKISGLFTQFETNGIIDSLLKTLFNDVLNDTVKAIGDVVLKNMFGLPYKVAVTGNKLVPYAWDMFMAPSTLKFPVYQGELKYIPEPSVTFFNIRDEDDNKIYNYSTTSDTSSQEFVELKPNECVYVSYLVKMPKNFERGIEATDELWTWFVNYPKVTNFKATLAGRYETSPWSGKYKRYKLLEKELEVFTQGISNNGWNLNRFYNGQNQSIKLDDNPDNWSIDQWHFRTNSLFENKTQLCFTDEDDIPDQFILNYNNFNYESTGSFLVNVRKPNKVPNIHNIEMKRDSTNVLSFIFYNISLSDDYTREDDLKLEVHYGDNTHEIIDREDLFTFSHTYQQAGTYEVTIKAKDENGTYSKEWKATALAGLDGIELIAYNLFKLPLDELNYNYNNWGDNPQLYEGTAGHAGIDIQTKDVAGGNPNNNLHAFYALSSGEVIASKKDGTYHLISVYNAQTDMSIIYLHANSIDVNVGNSVQIGDKLGIQGATGSNNAWHVHVEVREGKKTYAALNKDGTIDPIENLVASLNGVVIDDSNNDNSDDGTIFIPPTTTKTFKIHNVYDENGNYVKTVDTFYLSGIYNDNIIIESGTVYVDGYAKINGNLIQSGGNLNRLLAKLKKC